MEHGEKKVRFNKNIQVFNMCKWTYAYREARKSTWVTIALDRMRFQRRIKITEEILNPILSEKLFKINK